MIKIHKEVLFQLMHSHSRLAQAEYERDKAYNDSHFSAIAEIGITKDLGIKEIREYFDYVDLVTKGESK